MGKLGNLSRQLTEAVQRQGQVLPSENQKVGFYNAMAALAHASRPNDPSTAQTWADLAWKVVFVMLLDAYPDVPSKVVREYLDSQYGADFADRAVGTMPRALSMSQLAGELRKFIQQADRAIDNDLRRFASKEPEGAVAGTTAELEAVVGRVTAAWGTVRAQEAKKNWKQREDAMHDLMRAADALLTGCRAWFAQKR